MLEKAHPHFKISTAFLPISAPALACSFRNVEHDRRLGSRVQAWLHGSSGLRELWVTTPVLPIYTLALDQTLREWNT